MDITYNKVDQTALPISQDRVSASEYNQIAASLMQIITSAGLTPDSQDNAQLLNALGPRIVETYVNGTSWYRVWSDGWCEQGGAVSGISPTVTLLKTYKNTDYSILCLQQGTSGDYNANLRAQAIDTDSFTVFQAGGGPLSWQTWGYIS